MRIAAEFVTSVARIEQLPNASIPEIALVGRSNVGKSSLINALVGKKGLARTSNTPGRTQTLNYYLVDPEVGRQFYFVDMPGYGFAAVNLSSRAKWMDLIEEYLDIRETLCGVIQIIDLRHPPQTLDNSMSEFLQEDKHRHVVVGTKADKIGKTKIPGALKLVRENLNLEPENVLAFSAETGYGKDQLWKLIADLTSTPPQRKAL